MLTARVPVNNLWHKTNVYNLTARKVYPCRCAFILRNKYKFILTLIYRYWNGAVSWNPPTWTSRSFLLLGFVRIGYTHIPIQTNSPPPCAAYMHQWTKSALVQAMACCLFGAKPIPEPMVDKCIWNCRLPKWRPFCPGGDELNLICQLPPPSSFRLFPWHLVVAVLFSLIDRFRITSNRSIMFTLKK